MTGPPSKLVVLLAVWAVLVVRASAVRAADGEPAAASERPWAKDVPQERQDQALHIYEEANKLFEDSRHTDALTKYREARGPR